MLNLLNYVNMCKIDKENNKNTVNGLWSRDAITGLMDWFDGLMTDWKLISDQ